ncbi:MAG: glycerol-3-phosphate 1-O-acyltransferase PlsY [Ruminococcaceae bacterium]|nr:glycerol-3-phosphate 1-O-acyltransferase PlsY [Oscillospiraceae bacterium]
MLDFLLNLYQTGDTAVLGIVLLLMLTVAVAAYLLGCFNGAVIVSKYILRDDVRNHGSGNAGLTNFYRTFGGGLTFVVILCDALKAVLAVLIGAALFWLIGAERFLVEGKYWAALFCLLGHMFPCMFHFKGGKGILSGGAIALMIDWRIALVVWVGFIVLVALTRYVSLGSVWAGISFPFATWFCYQDPVIVVLGFLCGGLVVWQHRANIKRLIQGNENKFSFHRKKQ